jgi:phosphoglucomutase
MNTWRRSSRAAEPSARVAKRPIGGIKAIAAHGWFAARPSGTEAVSVALRNVPLRRTR